MKRSINLVELVEIAASEKKSEEFLRVKGMLKTFDQCPFCGNKNIGKIGRNFYKCKAAEQSGVTEKEA